MINRRLFFMGGSGYDADAASIINRIEADGGIAPNKAYMEAYIRKCKALNIWTDLVTAPDTNFGYKIAADGINVDKVYCLKGLDMIPAAGVLTPGLANNMAGNKSLLFNNSAATNTGLKTAANFPLSGNAKRQFVNLFRQTTELANKNIAGYGGGGSGEGYDVLLFNGTVIWHGRGAGNDTIGSAPSYTFNVLTVADMAYDQASLKSSVNGGARFSKAVSNINTTPSQLISGLGYDEGYNRFVGYYQPTHVWGNPFSDAVLAEFMTFIKSEYSIT